MRKINWIILLTSLLMSAILTSHASAMHNPTLGRFMQNDPIGHVDGPNDCQMEGDNPIRFIDASGSRHKSGAVGDRNADHTGFSVLWGQEFAARIVSKSFINGVPLGTYGMVGLKFGDFQAFAKFTDLSFQENPLTDAKDTHYRLYAKVTFHFFCDCMDRIHLRGPAPDGAPDVDMDGGYEAAGLVKGTINVDKPKITRYSDEALGFAYRAWGHPNALLEPSFQYFSRRTSVNIWHTSAGTIYCKNGKGHITTHSLQGSTFPSHKDWIMGDLIHTLSQGKFSSLWDADPGDPSFVD